NVIVAVAVPMVVTGGVLFLGNVTGFFPTFPFAGYLFLTAGGVLLWAGSAALVSARSRALGSPTTVELPLTREMYDCLKANAARFWRVFIPITLGFLLLGLVFGGYVLAEDDPLGMLHIVGPIVLGLGGLVWGIFLIQAWINARDRREIFYLRTTGPA